MRRIIPAGVMLAAAGYAAWVYIPRSESSGHPYVIDGDTLVINSKSFRLAGIDAEELSEPNGHRARRYLARLIGGYVVTCKVTGERSHNRYVARCRLPSGLDIGGAMVRSGHALDCERYSGGAYSPHEPPGIRKILISKPYCRRLP